MKKYIKKLLGITDLEKKVSELPEVETGETLEKLVRDAFSGDIAIFSKHHKWFGWDTVWFKDIVDEKVKEIFRDEIRSQVERRVEEIISDEKILDNLVERLKKKQLN